MKYREYFGITYQEAIDTPPDVFYRDLQMMSIESKYRENQAKQKTPVK